MYQLLGEDKRATCFDKLTIETISDYTKATLKEDVPEDVKASIGVELLDRFNARQISYAKCTSLSGEGFPTAGTKLFAMCFFVHRALGRTDRTDFDEILSGTASITKSDMQDIPGSDFILKWLAYFAGTVKALNLPREIRKLK